MDFLIESDKALFLYLNGFHSDFFDKVMWIVTSTLTWVPLYIILIIWFIRIFKKNALYIIVFAALSVVLSDLVSVYLFKEVFCRLRPSHEPQLDGLVHIVNGYKGGLYGFISSHAANSFSVAVFSLLMIRKNWYSFLIIFWALFFSYSRIYLGVHYPGDIICGAITGSIIAFIMYSLLKKLFSKKGIKISDRNF